MIKGRKIQSQNITLVVPNKSSPQIVNSSLTHPLHQQQQKAKPQKDQRENVQNSANKLKIIKEYQCQGKKDEKSKPSTKESKLTNPVSKPAEKKLTNHSKATPNQNIAHQTVQNQKKTAKSKPEQQSIRQHQAKNPQQFKTNKSASMKQQKDGNKQSTPCVVASQLIQQQEIPFQSDDDEIIEMERQTFPNPFGEDPLQEESFELQVNEQLKLEYLDDSSQEEQAFSFVQESHLSAAQLPINMDVFELTADQLLALDYFPL